MKFTPPCRVLIAVEPPAFVRLIEHVLQGHPGLRVIGRSRTADSKAARARRLAPDVIIANTRSGPSEPGYIAAQRLADLKGESPASRLVLLTHDLDDDLLTSSRGAAHARLREDAVVRRLVPVIRRLVALAS